MNIYAIKICEILNFRKMYVLKSLPALLLIKTFSVSDSGNKAMLMYKTYLITQYQKNIRITIVFCEYYYYLYIMEMLHIIILRQTLRLRLHGYINEDRIFDD